VKGGATRRSVLAALLTVPLLAATGCRTVAGATPASSPGSDVAILREAIAAKKKMIGLYTAVLAAHPDLAGQLDPLLADSTAHLAALQRRLINPGGTSSPSQLARTASASPAPAPSAPIQTAGAAIAELRSAERGAAAILVNQLRTVTPSLAQLLASIAACEATHVAALATGGLQ